MHYLYWDFVLQEHRYDVRDGLNCLEGSKYGGREGRRGCQDSKEEKARLIDAQAGLSTGQRRCGSGGPEPEREGKSKASHSTGARDLPEERSYIPKETGSSPLLSFPLPFPPSL